MRKELNRFNTTSLTNYCRKFIHQFLAKTVTFKLSSSRTCRGWAALDGKKSVVALSRIYAESLGVTQQDIDEVLLHEIGHVLCNNGSHGTEWKNVVRKLGGNPQSTFREPFCVGPFYARCPQCGYKQFYQRKPQVSYMRCCQERNPVRKTPANKTLTMRDILASRK